MPDPFTVYVLPAIIGGIGGLIVSVVSHYLTRSKETYERRYQFKERQLSEFYSPIYTRITKLTIDWELIEHLYADREELIKEKNVTSFEATERLRIPVVKAHREQYRKQEQLLEEILEIADTKFYYAEPSTRTHLRSLFRFYSNFRTSRDFHIPIDATGQEIPSPRKPFTDEISDFFFEIERIHNRLSEELTSGNLVNVEGKATDSLLKRKRMLPAVVAYGLEARLGGKVETDLMPAAADSGANDKKQYNIPVFIKNTGTVLVESLHLELLVPTILLVPGVTYDGSQEEKNGHTPFVITEEGRNIKIKPQQEQEVFRLTVLVSKDNYLDVQKISNVAIRLGSREDTTESLELSFKELDLTEGFSKAKEVENSKEPIQTIKIEDKQSIPEPPNKGSEEARGESREQQKRERQRRIVE